MVSWAAEVTGEGSHATVSQSVRLVFGPAAPHSFKLVISHFNLLSLSLCYAVFLCYLMFLTKPLPRNTMRKHIFPFK